MGGLPRPTVLVKSGAERMIEPHFLFLLAPSRPVSDMKESDDLDLLKF